MTSEVGLLVVGGGPAGVNAAIQARELGAEVTLLEAEQVGGTSLNRGPAPVRTLARAARLARDWSSWAGFRARRSSAGAQSAGHAGQQRQGRPLRPGPKTPVRAPPPRGRYRPRVEHLGPVRFGDPHTLIAGDGRSWRAGRIVLAVGGHAGRLAIPGQELALTYSDLRRMHTLPATAAVIGGADTGCQIASIFADLGARVRLFEAGPKLVPRADASVSTELARAFRRKGIETYLDTSVLALQTRWRWNCDSTSQRLVLRPHHRRCRVLCRWLAR